MYFYWSRVPQNIDAIAPSVTARSHPLTDLYAQWFGTRELLLHHRDPYSDDVARELQVAYYGKNLDPAEAVHPSHQQRFAYPLYIAFLLAPTVRMDFHTVQIIFSWLFAAVTASALPLWARAMRLRLPPADFAIGLIVTFTSIPVMQGLGLLQFGLLVAALLAAAAAAVVSGRLFLAGVLLAIATIKPQMSLLAILWFALWLLGDWRGRRSLFFGFAATLLALVGAAELLLRGWVMRFLTAMVEYEKHTHATSLLGIYLPSALHWLVAIAGLFIVATYAWRARQQPSDSTSFVLSLAFTLSLTLLIIPTVVPPFNHILLLPVVLLAIRHWEMLQGRDRLFRFASSVLCSIALLPWLFALVVTIGLLLRPLKGLLKIWFAPLNASLALPFAAFGVLILLSKVIPMPTHMTAGSGSPAPSSRLVVKSHP